MHQEAEAVLATPAQPDPRELIALPPSQRAAVALKSENAEKELRAMIERTSAIKNVVDKHGRDEAHRAAMMLKNARVAIQNTGESAREDAVAFQKAVLTEVKRLAAITADEEARLLKLRGDFDDKMAAEKAERERIELARKTGILKVIEEFRRLPLEHAGQGSEVLTGVLQTLAQREIMEDEFAEFTDEARAAIDSAAMALMTQREQAIAREDQARAEAEARRVEAERLEAQRAALAAQKAEQDRIAAEQAATLAEIKRVQQEAEAAARQAAADLEEQRAAFAREQEDARLQAEARLRAESAPPEPGFYPITEEQIAALGQQIITEGVPTIYNMEAVAVHAATIDWNEPAPLLGYPASLQPAPALAVQCMAAHIAESEEEEPTFDLDVPPAQYKIIPRPSADDIAIAQMDNEFCAADEIQTAPSELEIVDVLVEHYGAPRETVVGWLMQLDELLLKMAV